MWHAQLLALHEIGPALACSGAAHADALLFIEEGRDQWFAFSGGTQPLSRRWLAASQGAGLYVYRNVGGTGHIVGGSPAQWRVMLAQWPDDRSTAAAAKAIGDHFGFPVSLRAATYVAGTPIYWGERTYIMGILNVTPDSFSDGGCYASVEAALARARQMVADGANIIDVGGESTRPGASGVCAAEECDRVLPVIQAIVEKLGVPVSIDTSKARVAAQAVAAGATIVNDITGLRGDPSMADTVARLCVPVVVMHIQGTPRDMQENPSYVSVVPDVIDELQHAVNIALHAGIQPENIILDPGFGFGKNLQHNVELLRRIAAIRRLGYPVLSGTSRKSMVGALLNVPVDERLLGTAATVAHSVAGLADIVRVHDVAAMSQIVKVSDAIVRPRVVHTAKDG